MRFYTKKNTLISYNRLNKSNNKLLFQEDISIAGNKIFYINTPEDIFNKINENAESHFYEFWSEDMPIKFSYDIDINLKENPKYRDDIECNKLLEKLIYETQLKFLEYYDYRMDTSNIIILENEPSFQKLDNPDKKSYHIIFNKVKFENHLVAKDFYVRLNKDCKISQYFVDNRIYNLTCLRIFYCSKMGKKAYLIPKTIFINNEETNDLKRNSSKGDGYKYFLKSLITYTKDCNNIIKKDKIVNSIEKLKPKNSIANINNINIKHILDSLPMTYCDDYDKWSKIGMVLSNSSTNNINLYNLWNEWSSKSIKYKADEMEKRWESYSTGKINKLTMGTLIKWAQDENIDNIYIKKNNSIEDKVDMYKEKDILLDNFNKTNLTILNNKKLTHKMYQDKIDYKLLAVQSEKGTGKTSNLLKALFAEGTSGKLSLNNKINDNTSILFISSRITFGFKLLGDLSNYGFKLYSQIAEHHITSNRIICQLDSLMRLSKTSYDIIIVDECESLARYMTSSHFINNNKASLIIENLQLLIQEAKQVFIMDADLSDRCLNYYSKIMDIDLKKDNSKDYHVIQNTFKSFDEYTIGYMDFDTWIRKILVAIENNNKLVIASASNNKAKDILELIKQTFPNKKCILIHKETSIEEKRQLLLNVNREWCQYDVVLYTPSVCMGVSFDVENYFDNIYAYGCKDSLGSQEFAQMIHRVRSPKNLNIYLTLDEYEEVEENDNIINYETVESMLCNDYYLTNYDLHNNLIPKKIKLNDDVDIDDDNRIIYYPYKQEPIYDLYVRNSIEIIENRLNFSSTLFGYIKSKKYKLEYIKPFEDKCDIDETLEEIKENRKDKELTEKIDGIINAPELTPEDYVIKLKLKDEFLTKNDIYSIQKYNLRSCYNIQYDFLNPDKNYQLNDIFIKLYHNKMRMRWYRNIATILNIEDQTTEIKLEILKNTEQYNTRYSNCYLDFSKRNKYTFHKYPLDILNMLGFDINDLDIQKSYAELEFSLIDCMIYLNKFKNDILFKYNIKHFNKNLENEDYKYKIKYINKILTSQYGIILKKTDKSVKKDNIYYKIVTTSDEIFDKDKEVNIWNNLPDITDDITETFNFRNKIKPIKLKNYLNQNNIKPKNFDTKNLDMFIEDMDDEE
jgi:hypothetical protein